MNISNKFGTILIFHFNSILFQYLYKLYSFRFVLKIIRVSKKRRWVIRSLFPYYDTKNNIFI